RADLGGADGPGRPAGGRPLSGRQREPPRGRWQEEGEEELEEEGQQGEHERRRQEGLTPRGRLTGRPRRTERETCAADPAAPTQRAASSDAARCVLGPGTL